MHSVEEDVTAPQAAAASQGHLVSSMLLGEKKTVDGHAGRPYAAMYEEAAK